MNSLPHAIATVLAEVREMSGVDSAWLIGSRVNGTPSATSDWDIMLFATEQVLELLVSRWPDGVTDLDLLVAYDGEKFRSPWPRRDTDGFKRGTLSDWEWKQLSADAAVYTQRKPVVGGPHIDVSDARGVLLFRKEGGAV